MLKHDHWTLCDLCACHEWRPKVAHQLSTHLERQGVRVFGIVALDLRHLSSSVPGIVPRSLADFASRFEFQSSWGPTAGMFTVVHPYRSLWADYTAPVKHTNISGTRVLNGFDHLASVFTWLHLISHGLLICA